MCRLSENALVWLLEFHVKHDDDGNDNVMKMTTMYTTTTTMGHDDNDEYKNWVFYIFENGPGEILNPKASESSLIRENRDFRKVKAVASWENNYAS